MDHEDLMESCPVKMCRICFVTDSKMYSMTSCNVLNEAYETLTGTLTGSEQRLPRLVCAECAARLMNCADCARFRRRSLCARSLLLQVAGRHGRITVELVHSLMKNDNPFSRDSGSNLHVGHCSIDDKELEKHDFAAVKDEITPVEVKSPNDDMERKDSFVFDGEDVLGECVPSQAVKQEAERATETSQEPNELKIDDQQPPEADGPTDDVFRCDICPYQTDVGIQLMEHLKAHAAAISNQKYSCYVCRQVFISKDELKLHFEEDSWCFIGLVP